MAAARDDGYHLGATPGAVERTYHRIAEQLDRTPVELPEITVNGNVFRQLTSRLLEADQAFGDLAQFWQALSDPANPPTTDTVTLAKLAEPLPDNSFAVLYAIVCGDVSWPRDIGLYARNSAADRRAHPATAGWPANIWPCAFWAISSTTPNAGHLRSQLATIDTRQY